ncbi:Transposon protein, putative, CACTA, En/Spm sub-class [Thalictrum thalictroides]|uniref:Transposon protein, putative, CACTA, En/Spm sub-class n=1 Tax=Thalictrum thalictroides TaxID=46969 RepID=A0A7J6UR02_THATH|nr:Transposon protein, putative, CACTA, En/Spm sub-class [Thalictrum thalictroides]
MDKKQLSPMGFNIIFPSMVENAKDLGLKLPLSPNSVDKLRKNRNLELERESAPIAYTCYTCIANGSDFNVVSYNKFVCNGYTFSTSTYDQNKLVQNSGVSMKAFNSVGIITTYYEVIRGIFRLNCHHCTFTVFYCDWVNSEDRTAYKVDPSSKLVMVNLNKMMSSSNVDDEPFILASQARQVFYCKDAKHDGWSIVIPSLRRLTKAIDALEIDDTMYNSIIEENEILCALLECDGE